MGKVFHADDDVHKAVQAHCKVRGVRMKEWVAYVLTMAMNEEQGDVRKS